MAAKPTVIAAKANGSSPASLMAAWIGVVTVWWSDKAAASRSPIPATTDTTPSATGW